MSRVDRDVVRSLKGTVWKGCKAHTGSVRVEELRREVLFLHAAVSIHFCGGAKTAMAYRRTILSTDEGLAGSRGGAGCCALSAAGSEHDVG